MSSAEQGKIPIARVRHVKLDHRPLNVPHAVIAASEIVMDRYLCLSLVGVRLITKKNRNVKANLLTNIRYQILGGRVKQHISVDFLDKLSRTFAMCVH